MVTEQIVRDAFYKASEDRKKKPVVVEFENNLDDNCKLIADIINSGKVSEYVKYVKLRRKNTNGKWRDIDAPEFFTLVMQHVWIVLVKPLYMSKETGIARNCIEGRGICSEEEFGGKSLLPIEGVRLIKRRGYLLDGTAEIIEEIDPDEYYKSTKTKVS